MDVRATVIKDGEIKDVSGQLVWKNGASIGLKGIRGRDYLSIPRDHLLFLLDLNLDKVFEELKEDVL